ncbi:hypothetical protein BO94DRAFT_196203 [Aspergillus sclerotioniger CBS 115572]|uniref:Uncharacterized protein n=1 Tax=Aspergillus sclerotioniger CBS 115572 TaxID=1450535 RepID=A0A317VWA7_9EURO|nr:hypothetical protein BO94DRAFT_196203 [Aspergillus sclerotioniger CBS 115572]PWY77282.1 hypothetical protein BO94DRAFT_196203 [Aspergillus sclerotioniger CBS 115572]
MVYAVVTNLNLDMDMGNLIGWSQLPTRPQECDGLREVFTIQGCSTTRAKDYLISFDATAPGLPNYDGGMYLVNSGCRQDRCLRIRQSISVLFMLLPLGSSVDKDRSGCWLERHTGACGIRGQPVCDKVIVEAVYLPRFLYGWPERTDRPDQPLADR